jgi:VanZ family protein
MSEGYTRAAKAAERPGGWRPWLPALVWSGAILVLSCLPPGRIPDFGPEGMDRVLHAAFYAVLAVLTARAASASGKHESAVVAGTMVAALTFGGLMEWVQGFVGRTPDLIDGAADGIGAAVGLAAIAARRRRRRAA